MYVHMLLCTSTPTRRHVAPPLDLSGVAGHVLDPLPVHPLPFFLLPGFGLQKNQDHFSAVVSFLSRSLMFHPACSFLTSFKWLGFFWGGGWEHKDRFDWCSDSSVAEADVKQSRSSIRLGGRRQRSGRSAHYFQPWQ